MNILEWIILLLVAGVCGAVGAAIVGNRSFSFLVLIAIGFIGAMLGRWIAAETGIGEAFNLRVGSMNFPILWAIVGSMLLVGIVSLIARRRYA